MQRFILFLTIVLIGLSFTSCQAKKSSSTDAETLTKPEKKEPIYTSVSSIYRNMPVGQEKIYTFPTADYETLLNLTTHQFSQRVIHQGTRQSVPAKPGDLIQYGLTYVWITDSIPTEIPYHAVGDDTGLLGDFRYGLNLDNDHGLDFLKQAQPTDLTTICYVQLGDYLDENYTKMLAKLDPERLIISAENINLTLHDEVVKLNPYGLIFYNKLLKPELLAQLTNLHLLRMGYQYDGNDLSAIANLSHLTYLSINKWLKLTEITPIAKLTNLEYLNLYGSEILTDLTPLQNLDRLWYLNLTECKALTDISPVAKLKNLEVLELASCWELADVSPVTQLPHLKQLSLPSSIEDQTLAMIVNACPNLEHLDIPSAGFIEDLSILGKMKNLKTLTISGSYNTDLSFLSSLTNLQYLTLSGMNRQIDLTPLGHLQKLRVLDVSDGEAPHLNIEVLKQLPNLTQVKFCASTGKQNYTSQLEDLQADMPDCLFNFHHYDKD